jgi:hypothetical protein
MAISLNQLLNKMESEIHKAKRADNTSKVRESAHTIKVLCELILEESQLESSPSLASLTSPQIQVQATPTLPLKKLGDEEANGDSLFDF